MIDSKNVTENLIVVNDKQGHVNSEPYIDLSTLLDSEVDRRSSSISPLWKQIIAVTPLWIAAVEGGMSIGHSATLLPQLNQTDEGIPTDEYTSSWIASILGIPMVVTSLISGPIMQRYGRKFAMYIPSLLNPIGWLLLALAPSLTQMLVGRFLLGTSYGFIASVFGTYIGEVTDPINRGLIFVMAYSSVSLGVLLVHTMDYLMYWRWTAYTCGFICLIQLATLTIIPESPIWLISENKFKEGAAAFTWLRGHGQEAILELKDLIEKHRVQSRQNSNLKQRIAQLRRPQFLKPFFLLLVLFVVSQCSGVNHLVFYAFDIVNRSVGSDVNKNLVIVSIDVVRLITAVISCFANKEFARRPVFFTSSIGAGISMICLMIYIYCANKLILNASWLPITCLISFILFVTIGIMPLPILLSSELFPINLRDIGNAIMITWGSLMLFFVSKLTPAMFINFGELITFGTCLLLIVIGGVIAYFFLPETKGRTLQEIQDNYKK